MGISQSVSGVNSLAVGIITQASDFPTLAQVQIGKSQYIIVNVSGVIDNDPTKTDTGQTFANGAYIIWNGINWTDVETGGVVGPVSSTLNALPRYATTDGAVIKNSGVIIDDSNNVTGINNLTISGAINDSAAVSVASGTTTNIGAAASSNVLITGTTTITAFDTVGAGIVRRIRFNGALLLTYNGTSLILPTLQNIKTAVNDTCFALSLGSGNWFLYNYQSASGNALPNAVNNQTGTTYSFALTDIGGTVTASNASASTYTLPQTSNIAFPIGSRIKLINLGAGAVTLVKEGSETLIGNANLNQNATAEIEKTSATQWEVFGGTATVNMIGISTFIQVVANNTYNLNYFPGCAGTILGVAEKARALTTAGTFKIQINGVDVTGLTAVAPTTGGAYTAATGANTFTRGQSITITYSGTTAVLDHDVVIDWTQQF